MPGSRCCRPRSEAIGESISRHAGCLNRVAIVTAVVTVLSNADAPALRLMISREPKGLSLIGPIRRHIHQTRDAEAARKGSVDRRLHDVFRATEPRRRSRISATTGGA